MYTASFLPVHIKLASVTNAKLIFNLPKRDNLFLEDLQNAYLCNDNYTVLTDKSFVRSRFT